MENSFGNVEFVFMMFIGTSKWNNQLHDEIFVSGRWIGVERGGERLICVSIV